jgi:hypothetical protein
LLYYYTQLSRKGELSVAIDDRQIGRYDFEGGAFVRISVSGDIDTEEALDMVQTIIDLKRKELARRNLVGRSLNVGFSD